MNFFKASAKIFAIVYFTIGSVLGLVMWGSYQYASWIALFNARWVRVWMIAAEVETYGLYTSAVRVVVWGPSVYSWIKSGSRGWSFGEWLAPGIYTTFGPI
ncbi:MAG: hypothetical protein ACREDH_08680, partial [Methylocella sp.]